MKRKILGSVMAAVVSVALSAGPTTAAATSATYPFATGFPTCSGGLVYLTGFVHIKQMESESDYKYNYVLSGTDQLTGERYRLNSTIVGMFTGSPDGRTVVQTFIRHVRLIGLAGAESFTAKVVMHVTEVDGTVTASLERIVPLC